MSRGFRGQRFLVFWGTILPVLWLLAAGGASHPLPRPPWWEVRIALTVRGDYTVKDFETTFAGEFTCRAQWEGSMEPDGPDFLLYRTRTDVPDWEILEKAALPNATRILTQRETAEKPRLRLNYVIRQGRDLRFDFEVEGIRVPLSAWPEKFDLVLPRSKESFGEGTGYDDFISKGTNLVSIGDDGLERDRSEKSFSWEWKRQHWAAREKGAVFVSGSHKVSVTVTLIRH
jgi:hypothetical protein